MSCRAVFVTLWRLWRQGCERLLIWTTYSILPLTLDPEGEGAHSAQPKPS